MNKTKLLTNKAGWMLCALLVRTTAAALSRFDQEANPSPN